MMKVKGRVELEKLIQERCLPSIEEAELLTVLMDTLDESIIDGNEDKANSCSFLIMFVISGLDMK